MPCPAQSESSFCRCPAAALRCDAGVEKNWVFKSLFLHEKLLFQAPSPFLHAQTSKTHMLRVRAGLCSAG